MQFLVTGYDGADDQALSRRMAVREKHLAGMSKLREGGQLLYAAAMLGEKGQLSGSTLVMDFPDRAALDAWLKTEPYVTGDVWRRIEVVACRVAPGFEKR